MRPLLAAVLAGLCLAAGPSHARPFTIDDFLALEDIGEATITADGRWLILERLPPYGDVGDFGTDSWLRLGGRKLQIADLRAQKPVLEPLFAQDVEAGYVAGPVSPGGGRMVVYRLRDRAWTLGVADLRSHRVRWFDIAVERQSIARTAQWRDDDNLVVIAAPSGLAPSMLRRELTPTSLLPGRWRAMAKGELSVSAIGAGRWIGLRTPTPLTRIIEIDLKRGGERQIATGAFLDLELSPDGSRIATFTREEDLAPTQDQVSAVMPHRIGVAIVDRLTGKMTVPCPACDHLPHLMSWSSSGRELLSFTRGAGLAWEDGQFMRMSVSGETRIVDEGRPRLSYHVTTGRTASGFWMGDDPVVLVSSSSGRAQWRLATAGGSVNLTQRLASAPDRPVAADKLFAWFISNGALWRADRKGEVRYVASSVTGALPSTPLGSGARAAWSYPPNFDRLVYKQRRGEREATSGAVLAASSRVAAANHQTALVLTADDRGVRQATLHRAGQPPLPLITLNRHLAAIDPVRVEAVHHLGRDGRPLSSWLFLPAAAAEPPPVVVVPYPGPARAAPSASFLPGYENPIANVQMLVGAGYAVLQPSLPLEAGDRQAIHHVGEDILSIVDAAADRDLVDRRRVALWGHSFGGYTVMMAATQSRRFCSVIAMAGIYDLASVRNIGPLHERLDPRQGAAIAWTAGWTQDAQANMRGGPWAHPDDYVRNSPLFAANRITAPVMLVHNDLDYIPPWQAEEMFGALHAQEKDAVLLTYWGEGHGVRSPANLRDLYARALDWLDRGFKPGPIGAAPKPGSTPPSTPGSIGR